MKVLLLMNENNRAAVACMRSLKNKNLKLITAYNKKSIINKAISMNMQNVILEKYTSETEKSFIDSIIQIQKRNGELKVFLFGDQVSYWLIRNKKYLNSKKVFFDSPTLDSYTRMLNKGSFLELIKEYEINEPERLETNYIMNTNFSRKFVIKPKSNTGETQSILKSPLLIENETAFKKLKNRDIDFKEHIIQEYVEGPSYYYTAIYSEGNKLMDFSQKNIAQQPGGKSVIKAIPINLPVKTVNNIDNMMSYLNWNGPMMIELKKNKKEFLAIECNPRLWGPLQLAVDNGIDYPIVMYNLHNKEVKTKQKNKTGYVWITGYLLGILYKIKTRTNFQIFRNDNKNIKYKDIWFRKDTGIFAILELPHTVYSIIQSLIAKG